MRIVLFVLASAVIVGGQSRDAARPRSLQQVTSDVASVKPNRSGEVNPSGPPSVGVATGVRGQGPAFDVASIRQNVDSRSARAIRVTPTSVEFTSVSLLNCLEEAYGVSPHQITGPSWIRTERYDITARTDVPVTRSQMMARLQTLLTDRFGLILRRSQQELRVLVLVVGKDVPRLTSVAGDGEARREPASNGALGFRNTSMRDLAAYLSRQGPIGVPVFDETNLDGRFDFVLSLVRGPAGAVDVRKAIEESGPAAYIDAIAELGLRLDSRRRPLDVIVVDRAERIPTAN